METNFSPLPEKEKAMTEYPATALESVVFALLTALKAFNKEDEGADLHGRTVEELLISALDWHPEPVVSNWAKHEIHRLFADFQAVRSEET